MSYLIDLIVKLRGQSAVLTFKSPEIGYRLYVYNTDKTIYSSSDYATKLKALWSVI